MNGEYQRRIELALAQGIIDQRSSSFCQVQHDQECAVFAGADCNCDPWITVLTVDFDGNESTFMLDKNGMIQKVQ